jgi:membrane-associated phospholipid phosphatase
VNGAVLVGVVALLAVIIAGGVLTATAPMWVRPDRLLSMRKRLYVAGDGLVSAFGRPGAAVAAVFASAGFLIGLLWALGELAQKIEPYVDHPTFRWFAARQVEPWSSIWWKLTNIGKVDYNQRTVAVAAVAFAVMFALRGMRWWAPPFLLVAGFLLEKGVQETTKVLVNRGHPPTTLGSWPSGGCARVMIVYGLIIFLGLTWARVRSKRIWVAGWSLVALAETVQAYARTYNLEHWITDVVGGIILGTLALLTMLAVARLVLPPAQGEPRAPRHAEPAARRQKAQPDREPALLGD